MKVIKLISLLLILLLISSCDYEEFSKSLIPEKESIFAKEYIQKLRQGDFNYIRSHLTEELLPQVTDEKLNEIINYFPKGDLLSTELIGSQTNTISSPSGEKDLFFGYQWQGSFTYEYEFEEGWAIANVVMRTANNQTKVYRIHVTQTKASQKEINAFTLKDKSFLQLIILLAAISAPVFIVITLVVCLRTPMTSRKNKVLWVLAILLGVGSISVNWTTGQYSVQILKVWLLGAGCFKSGWHGPWSIFVGIPLFAIIFWFKRNKFIENTVGISDELSAMPENMIKCNSCNNTMLQDDLRGDVCPVCSGVM